MDVIYGDVGMLDFEMRVQLRFLLKWDVGTTGGTRTNKITARLCEQRIPLSDYVLPPSHLLDHGSDDVALEGYGQIEGRGHISEING